MAVLRSFAVFVLLLRSVAGIAESQESTFNSELQDRANPVRKVVTMLQMMMKKIEAEGKKEEELYDKYMCYCKTGDETLSASIDEAKTKIPQVESQLKQAIELKAQLEVELENHQKDRDAAKEALAKAAAIREKEANGFSKESSIAKSNIEALSKAIPAIEKGMAGGFLQTEAATVLRRLSVTSDMSDSDRDELVSFLSGSTSSGYVPKSAEIVGILKQMKDEMEKDLADSTANENSAIATYEELVAAKNKEIEALTKAIEEKLKRVGELGVEVVTMKNDLEDTKESLAEDEQFLANLSKDCATKTKEWEARSKTRSEELIALSETIKILNDDDALELFKKALPSASFLQVQTTGAAIRARALKIMKSVKSTQADLITLALHGKKIGFEKVIAMIDEMVKTLAKEQQDDDHKKEYCQEQFDISDDSKKELERSIADGEKAMAETKDALATTKEEITALEEAIHALDKNVAAATEQRKEEHEEYVQLMATNNAAKELILFAKNRMQKFYNPKLYKPPPKRVLSEEERITLNMGGTLAPTNPPGGIAGTGVSSLAEIRVHADGTDAPPPPPEIYGEYSKKTEESGGVLAMMDLLVQEVDKEMQEAEMDEKDGQGDYVKFMTESADMRSQNSKSMTEKEGAKADLETQLQDLKDTKKADEKELAGVLEYIQTLHADCDWLLEHFSERKEARASEVDALKKAKAVLSGADFSLMQLKAEDRDGGFLKK